MFLKSLGVYTVNYAFGLNDERIHSPNEFFRLSSFVRGQRGYCMLLHEIANSVRLIEYDSIQHEQ